MRINACAVKQKVLFGTEWILRPNFEETMPDTVKPLATTLPCPSAQIPSSPDGIIQHSLRPGEQQTQRHYLESGQGAQGVLLQKQEPYKLNASQMSMLYLCQLLVGDSSLTPLPRGLHG